MLKFVTERTKKFIKAVRQKITVFILFIKNLHKANKVILITLLINLIGHNLHPYLGSALFYYCEYLNYAIFYLLIYFMLLRKENWILKEKDILKFKMLCGVGVLFCINDFIDLKYNPFKNDISEWIFCICLSTIWYYILKYNIIPQVIAIFKKNKK